MTKKEAHTYFNTTTIQRLKPEKLLESLASSLIKRHLKSTVISEGFQGSYAAAPQGFLDVMRRKLPKCLKEKYKKQGTIQTAQGIRKINIKSNTEAYYDITTETEVLLTHFHYKCKFFQIIMNVNLQDKT